MKTPKLRAELQHLLPMTPAVFFVLLALGEGEKHGYAIMQETLSLSGGQFRMGPATLYTTLQRLLELALIDEVAPVGTALERDSRRRYYRLNGSGKLVLQAEVDRMDSVVRLAKRRRLSPKTVE